MRKTRETTTEEKRAAGTKIRAVAGDAGAHCPQQPEPFVDAARAGDFLSLRPRRVLELAREGTIPAYPLGGGERKVWRFRLSELASAVCAGGVNWARQSPAPR